MAFMDWNLLKSFVAVAETGSLSAAARKIEVSQPSVGRHVAELERQLGIKLFRRGRAGYELSEDGIALLGRARAMREQAEAISRLALGATEAVAGTVRIAASEVVSAYVLPSMTAAFAEMEPGIEIEIVASNQVENLLRRDADIAIRMVEPSQLDLVARKITDIPLTACAATSYLDRRGRPASPAEIVGHDLVGYDRGMELIDGFREFGVEIDRHGFRFRTDNQIVFWEAIRTGNGIGFAQVPLVDREPLVEVILPGLPLPSLPMWLAMHRDVRTSARIRRVADFLYEQLKDYAGG
ncbi:LysR family transcriptional regulator [Aquibium oceanicum]|uniref:LysR family transcriptional regulator n=1 Tax=Aquibium oceanicum TaxID=1670800 RepID=A0A1L3SKS6_9HYPH|nr:LysR family transcriptional regulator [Aquibium oceanicum]APH69981.1 LysR family transcriptional regulator [Aquibium oceanicum]